MGFVFHLSTIRMKRQKEFQLHNIFKLKNWNRMVKRVAEDQ